MHTKLNIPVIFNLFPKVSIPLEQIHASKQVFKAELTVPYFRYPGCHYPLHALSYHSAII